MKKEDRLNEAFSYLKNKGLVHTQKDLANKIGTSATNMSSALHGVETVLTDKFLERFNNAFDNIFNVTWLLTGEGEMLSQRGPSSPDPPPDDDRYRLVPLINIDSVGGMHSSNAIVDEPQYTIGLVPFVGAQDDDVCITESGNSMIPTIPPGSMLLLRNVPEWREYFGYGGIFVIELKDGRRITKEVRRSEENAKTNILCHSHNGSVPDEELPKAMIVSVWKVVKVLTNLGF